MRTLVLTAKAQSVRLRDAYNNRQILAWQIANLQRAKRLPRLKTLLIEEPKKKKVQTWQEQLAVLDQLAAMMERVHSPMKRVTPDARDHDT